MIFLNPPWVLSSIRKISLLDESAGTKIFIRGIQLQIFFLIHLLFLNFFLYVTMKGRIQCAKLRVTKTLRKLKKLNYVKITAILSQLHYCKFENSPLLKRIYARTYLDICHIVTFAML